MAGTFALTTTAEQNFDLTSLDGQTIHTVPVLVTPSPPAPGAGDPVFQLAPGSPLVGTLNVYGTWAAVVAAMAPIPGPKWLEIEGTFSGFIVTVPSGVWIIDDVTIVSSGDGSSVTTLQFLAGAQLVAARVNVDGPTIQLQNASATTSPMPSNNPFLWVLSHGASIVCSTGAAPFFAITNSSQAMIQLHGGASLGTPTTPPVMTIGTELTASISLDSSSVLAPDTIEGAGVAQITYDTTCVVPAQLAATTLLPVGTLGSTFVYAPGQTQEGNVYATWGALMQALSLVAGDRIVELDGTAGALVVAAGAWNVDGVTFTTRATTTTFPAGTLSIPTGASLTFGSRLTLRGNVTLQATGTTPAVTASNGAILYVYDGAEIAGGAGAPFVTSAVTQFSIMAAREAQIGDGVHAAINVTAGNVFMFAFDFASIEANVKSGAGGMSLRIDDSVVIGSPNAGVVPTLTSIASQVAYTPVVPGNWGTAPTVVGGTATGALDLLVDSNIETFTTPVQISPFSSLALPAPGIKRIRNGLFLVVGTLSGVSTNSTGEVSMQLTRDGVAIGPLLNVGQFATTQPWSGTIAFVDQITDTANHIWAITAAATGATLSIFPGTGTIQATEL